MGDGADPRIVPPGPQLGQEVRQPRLELDDAVVLHPPARCVERRLGVVAVVHDAAHDLEVTLGLHRSAHHPERPEKLAVLEEHPGDDRVERPGRRRERVRVSRDLAEAGGAVLEHDPCPGCDDPRAEGAVDALDERHRHAVAVHGAEVGRPAARRLDTQVDRAIVSYERPAGSQPLVREQIRGQRPVVHERVSVGEGELHRLDLGMQPRLEAVVEREREEGGHALAVRRQLADLDPAIEATERLDPLGAVGEKVALGEPGRGGDRRSEVTRVQGIRALGGNAAECPRELRERVTLPRFGSGPRRVSGPRPLVRDAGAARDPRDRGVGRRADGPVEPEPAEALCQVTPEPHGTRHGHRPWPVVVGRGAVEICRRAARAVDPV